MVLNGVDGTVVLISNGNVAALGPASGMVSFDAAGDAQAMGHAHNSTLPAQAVESCAAVHCPLQSCLVRTVESTVKEVLCSGVALWTWPSGVVLEALRVEPNRRGLIPSCDADYEVCRDGCPMDSMDALSACLGDFDSPGTCRGDQWACHQANSNNPIRRLRQTKGYTSLA